MGFIAESMVLEAYRALMADPIRGAATHRNDPDLIRKAILQGGRLVEEIAFLEKVAAEVQREAAAKNGGGSWTRGA